MDGTSVIDSDTKTQVRAVVEETLATVGVSTEITNDALLIESGLLDSMGVVVLVQGLQARFDVELDFADITLENFASIDAIAGFLTDRS